MISSTFFSALIALPLVVAGPVPVIHQAAVAVPPQAGGGGLGPFDFTSTYNLVATPDRVRNAESAEAPGEAGAIGYYNYGINSELDVICWNITLMGVTGPYDSPALTATHIHEAAEGTAGPPRIAFPNPEPADSGPEVVKRTAGCFKGPFVTGIQGADGTDTGAGFTLKQIEANPAGFFTDSHTVVSVAGVVRAQLQANAPGAVAGAAPGVVVQPGQAARTCTTQVIQLGPPLTVVCLN
ncbi:hypothetical protein B0T11DRAFT_67706 [Plectosphaerella cucumerina]|uniref:CHRD domain-containing protein n=1 Tax=Plectosphaerella cucumerina TaxID=40658 RepID=A0A8K0X6Y9_9PEZI|nr:hypothetical protein B0T11DRAFT_67706 [Plectosphaerella cucumerina]